MKKILLILFIALFSLNVIAKEVYLDCKVELYQYNNFENPRKNKAITKLEKMPGFHYAWVIVNLEKEKIRSSLLAPDTYYDIVTVRDRGVYWSDLDSKKYLHVNRITGRLWYSFIEGDDQHYYTYSCNFSKEKKF